MSTHPLPHAPAAPAAPPQPSVGSVPLARRALAPDVARGLALLGIALANSAGHLSGADLGVGARPVDGSALDRAVNLVVALFVDRRTMPMFALLYGYGIGVVVRRRAAAWVPWPACRGDLLRRAGFLVLFGAVHLLLLFQGDILTAYGLAGLLAVALVRAKDRTLLVTAVAVLPVAALLMGGMAALTVAAGDMAGSAGGAGSAWETHPLLAMLGRLVALALAPLGALVALPMVLVGLWAARREVLEQPGRHLVLLRRTAVVGLTVGVLGALPYATAVGGLREASALDAFATGALHELTGVGGGMAFAALVGLVVAARADDAAGRVTRALRAVGARSMTCYLLQSVLFVLPLAPWAGGLGVGMGTAQVAAWAVGVWLVTVAVAVALDAAGRRGPAEALYRRLVYRRPAA